MSYIQRIDYRPSKENLTSRETNYIQEHFDAYGSEVWINGDAIRWEYIEEIEVVVAARAKGPAGWLVKNVLMGGDRYHVGVYYGYNEAVLTNMTLDTARYVVQTMAYYAPNRIKYTGPEGITPLTEY